MLGQGDPGGHCGGVEGLVAGEMVREFGADEGEELVDGVVERGGADELPDCRMATERRDTGSNLAANAGQIVRAQENAAARGCCQPAHKLSQREILRINSGVLFIA